MERRIVRFASGIGYSRLMGSIEMSLQRSPTLPNKDIVN